MKMFITKNALTKGIQEAEGEYRYSKYYKQNVFTGKINSPDYDRSQTFFPKDFFESIEEAYQDAARRVLVKIASHEKAIERLKKLQFVTSNIEV